MRHPTLPAVKHLLPTLAAAAALLLPHALGQMPTDTVKQGEFPGLQLLPPGSVIEGISLPRYDNHRVSALLHAARMIISTRQVVQLEQLEAQLYSRAGSRTYIRTGNVAYDFGTQQAATTGDASVQDERFSAQGKGVIFSSATRKGILLGPVRTTVSAAVFNRASKNEQP